MPLTQFLARSTAEHSNRTAVEEISGRSITYRELDAVSDSLRDRLVRIGVQPGDRVGIYLPKSIDSVISIFGILKGGAAYVPVDSGAPAGRNAFILNNCAVRAVLAERRFVPALREEIARLGTVPMILECDAGNGGGEGLRKCLDREQKTTPAKPAPTHQSAPDELAYILYTSGSTGKPKGVMISQRNADSFVDWCSEVFEPSAEDRFSSHAPFHFDLSILDVFASVKHGATLVLIPEDVGKEPIGLARLMAEKRITIWYSAPSILALMAQFGRMETLDYSHLRMILFAGEVFPVGHLRTLKNLIPRPRYFNLYGPTETNVCTYYEIPDVIPVDRLDPYPIGKVCSHLRGRVVDSDGGDVARGTEGELCIAGPSVMNGYWGLAQQTTASFLPDSSGERWYKTGDIVREEPDGNYRFVGRRDRMVKKRGFRVELGEIEACLYQHQNVREAAVVALPDEEAGLKIRAHLSTRDGRPISLIALKQFCSERVPVYMIPDVFRFHDALPKTSTDKTDYQAIKWME